MSDPRRWLVVGIVDPAQANVLSVAAVFAVKIEYAGDA